MSAPARASDRIADTTDSSFQVAPVSPAVMDFSAGTSREGFNSQFRLASQTADTANVLPMTISTDVASAGGRDVSSFLRYAEQVPRGGDAAIQPRESGGADYFDKQSRPRLSFRNINASEEFGAQVRQAMNESISQFNPETQKLLNGLKVATVDRIKTVVPSEEKEHPGMYTSKDPKMPNTVLFVEKTMQDRGLKPEDLARHELGHPIDEKTRASSHPEFRAAFEQGMRRVPVEEQDKWAKKFKLPRSEFRAEVFADLVATNMGSTPDRLGYLKEHVKHFPEAEAWIKRRFFKP